jgi:DNA-directed RNA polymerase specialized sigma24 family protein
MLDTPQPGFHSRGRHSIEVRLLAGQALRLAGERDRILLQLHFIQGWSQKEIAGSLRISENTIASSLARAKVRLKKIVQGPARRPASSTPRRRKSQSRRIIKLKTTSN